MPKRKPMAQRKACGRIVQPKSPPALPPPVEIRRLRDAALCGMRTPEWGTQLGRLFLTDQLTPIQYAAGKHWAALAAEYSTACQSPRAPVSAKLDPAGGTPPDPDTVAGSRVVRRHLRVIENYTAAKLALATAGQRAERMVRAICEDDQVPAGWVELQYLKEGLQMLAAWWAIKRPRKFSVVSLTKGVTSSI